MFSFQVSDVRNFIPLENLMSGSHIVNFNLARECTTYEHNQHNVALRYFI